MQINFVYDSSVQNAPAGFKQGLIEAANIIDAVILNPISVNIDIGFGEDNGSPLANNTLGEAQPAFGELMSYSEVVAGLTGAATSADDATFVKNLPATDPSNGAGFFVSAAQSIAWGVIPGSATEIDGFAGFSSHLPFTYDPTNGIAFLSYDFVGVALHELTHALGRTITPAFPTPLNLLGYGSSGKLDTNNADARYLSFDGGKTHVVNFDTSSDQADFASNGPLDPFNAGIAIGEPFNWTTLDSRVMDLLGFRVGSSIPVPPPEVAPKSPTQAGIVALQGSHDQYVVANDKGVLYLKDTVAGRDGTQTLPSDHVMLFTDGTGVFDPGGTAENVARLYLTALHRAPDLAGLEAWTAAIDTSHVPMSAVANSFATSPEFIRDYGSLSNAGFVAQLYLNALGRPEDAAGAQGWDNVLTSGMSRGAVTLSFAESQEEAANTVATAGDGNDAEVYRLYQAAFSRPPDPAGENFWSSALAGGATPMAVAQSFVSSSEFQQTYGGLSASDFVSALYQNALHRPADPGGLQAWTNMLQQGATQANVIVDFSDSLESRVQTAGATHADWVFIPT
jgi:Domain of unknown function (DUF4214)